LIEKRIRKILKAKDICVGGIVAIDFACLYCGELIEKGQGCHKAYVCSKKECINKYEEERKEFKKKYRTEYQILKLEE